MAFESRATKGQTLGHNRLFGMGSPNVDMGTDYGSSSSSSGGNIIQSTSDFWDSSKKFLDELGMSDADVNAWNAHGLARYTGDEDVIMNDQDLDLRLNELNEKKLELEQLGKDAAMNQEGVTQEQFTKLVNLMKADVDGEQKGVLSLIDNKKQITWLGHNANKWFAGITSVATYARDKI